MQEGLKGRLKQIYEYGIHNSTRTAVTTRKGTNIKNTDQQNLRSHYNTYISSANLKRNALLFFYLTLLQLTTITGLRIPAHTK
jgi:hypothetical protein